MMSKIIEAQNVLENMKYELTRSQYQKLYTSLNNVRKEYDFLKEQNDIVEHFEIKKRKRVENVVETQKEEIKALREREDLLVKQKAELEEELKRKESGFYFGSNNVLSGRSLFKPRMKPKKCLFCPSYVDRDDAMCESCSQRAKRRKN